MIPADNEKPHPNRKTGVPADSTLSVGWKYNRAARVGHPVSAGAIRQVRIPDH